jgi:hypothetical protein
MIYRNCDFTVLHLIYQMPMSGELPAHVYAYHITPAKNVESILDGGLKAKSCVAATFGEGRRPAVYLLACKADAYDSDVRAFLFGASADLAVLRVRLPQDAYEMMREDGLFNISCICSDGTYPTGIQFTGDIPAGWIEVLN